MDCIHQLSVRMSKNRCGLLRVQSQAFKLIHAEHELKLWEYVIIWCESRIKLSIDRVNVKIHCAMRCVRAKQNAFETHTQYAFKIMGITTMHLGIEHIKYL